MVRICDQRGRIYAFIDEVSTSITILDYLQSKGAVVLSNRKVFYFHQSVLDCFFADEMTKKYYAGQEIYMIIGASSLQTPGRRYQTQMFLQQLLENDDISYIEAAEQILCENRIRFSYKILILELLSQIDHPTETIKRVILRYLENGTWGNHILYDVIAQKCIYVDLLVQKGILQRWLDEAGENTEKAIGLIASCCPNYSQYLKTIIAEYIFKNDKEYDRWAQCFSADISSDSDDLFEIRKKFAYRYSGATFEMVDYKRLFKTSEIRAIEIIAILLELKIRKRNSLTIDRIEKADINNNQFFENNFKNVIDILLPFVPKHFEKDDNENDWKQDNLDNGLERICIYLLCKANEKFAEKKPEEFLNRYKPYLGTGIALHNEILMKAYMYLPVEYADQVIQIIIADHFKNIFEDTSGEDNSLALAKKVITKFAPLCNEDLYCNLEESIVYYIDDPTKQYIKYSIKSNLGRKRQMTLKSYWGDFQREILPCLPQNRISVKARSLLQVLMKNDTGERSIYMNHALIRGGFVVSPVSGKKLTVEAWRSIITKDLKNEINARCDYVQNGIVEHSVAQYARSFAEAVKEEPDKMIGMLLTVKEDVHKLFIDAIYNGLPYVDRKQTIDAYLLKQLVQKYPPYDTNRRIQDICCLVESHPRIEWSDEVLQVVYFASSKAANHHNIIRSMEDTYSSENIIADMLNSTRGYAARAIGKLAQERKIDLNYVKSLIDNYCDDDDPSVNMAGQIMLYAIYDENPIWGDKKLLWLYQKDIRMAAYYGSRQMLFHLYKMEPKIITSIIERCFYSSDDRLIEVGGKLIADLFIYYDSFHQVYVEAERITAKQIDTIIRMLAAYLESDELREKAKEGIMYLIDVSSVPEHLLGLLIHKSYLRVDEDQELIKAIARHSMNGYLIQDIFDFLKMADSGILSYSELIIEICKKQIQKIPKHHYTLTEIPEMILLLYDEACKESDINMDNLKNECLDLWDELYKMNVGRIKRLSEKLMER